MVSSPRAPIGRHTDRRGTEPQPADGLFQVFPGSGGDQLAVLNSAEAQNLIGDMFQFAASPLHDDDLKTVVMIQMNMCGGQDLSVGIMLYLD